MDKLITLVIDGPNVNKAIVRKTKIQSLKDLLILEAVFCMSYITVLVKDLKCTTKTSISYAWIFMPSSSTLLR